MIGSVREARAIAGYEEDEQTLPEGWKYVGSGASRSVYLAPSGVVYKTPHWGDDYANRSEVKHAKRLRRYRSKLWRWDVSVPDFTPYVVEGQQINAAEYLPTQVPVICECYDGYEMWTEKPCNCRKFGEARPCFALVWEFLEQEFGLEDVWEGNLSYHNKKIHLIDLGEFS